eukprot:TRINITY_DN9044_c1_g2_i3.p1 TRINITY_DN9044_c1_g2~~TRINITY_DN9044_c1_g2_i3.p1  ORF type:complete len:811 (-),score=44.67 TRINITY_DN9044_c1_g2_i3:404-2725(-)
MRFRLYNSVIIIFIVFFRLFPTLGLNAYNPLIRRLQPCDPTIQSCSCILQNQPEYIQNGLQTADNCSRFEIFPLFREQATPLAPIQEPVQLIPYVQLTQAVQQFSQELQDFIRQKEEIVLFIHEQVRDAYERREQLVQNCSCVPNRCSNTLGVQTTCGDQLGAYELCGRNDTTQYTLDYGSALIALPEQYPNQLAGGVQASICFMKHLEQIVPQLKARNVTSWAYIGLEVGSHWSYPGRLRSQSTDRGIEQWGYCEAFDPRSRVWYHEGATGPLDIVIVVDISESMRTSQRWQVLREALKKLVDSITFTDYFNIIFFNFRVADEFKFSTGLVPGTKENRDKVKEFIDMQSPYGQTNFEEAFVNAFEAFKQGVENNQTSGCKQVILFMTDGQDTKITQGPQSREEEILDKLDQLQDELQEMSGQRASIFSFSISKDADNLLPRQIACLHDGAWQPIKAEDNPMTVFNTFVKFLAAGRDAAKFYWSEIYEDASGLGEIITVSLPVFIPFESDKVVGPLFGVVAHDIRTSELRQLAGDQFEDLIEALHTDSRQCDNFTVSTCQQQVLRGEEKQCPDRSYASATCTKFNDKFYYKSLTKQRWEDAKNSCEQIGGKIAVPNTSDEQRFLAGIAAVDGSLIGLSNLTGSWTWEDINISIVEEQVWAIAQPRPQHDCARIAPSGSTKNVYSTDCTKRYSYVCEVDSSQTLPEQCNNVYADLDLPNSYKLPQIQQCVSTEDLEYLYYLQNVQLNISSNVLFCNEILINLYWKGNAFAVYDE